MIEFESANIRNLLECDIGLWAIYTRLEINIDPKNTKFADRVPWNELKSYTIC
jgi:hypothetical protein